MRTETYPNTTFDDKDVSRLLQGKSYVDFRTTYFREELGIAPHLYDGFSYRLVRIDSEGDSLSLGFARSKYFGYVNSCEIIAFEAALNMNALKPTAAGYERFWGGDPNRLFDLSNRNAIAGICTLLVLSDSDGRPSFVMHNRDDVIEGRNAYHVVPAGNFQPMIAPNGEWTEVAWERDYCILDAILREFIEEILGYEESVRIGALAGNWLSNENVKKAYDKLVAAIRPDSGPAKCRVWFFGVGFDPLTAKPELLACMVMDRRFFNDLNPQLTNREGHGHKLELSEPELRAQLQRVPWLSAGQACMRLLIEHYNQIVALP